MLKFIIDEDMPRSTAKVLELQGYKALDIRDCGLRGKSDEEIFKFAQKEKGVILTGDLGFGNLLSFPLGSHCGIVIVHFPNEVSVIELNNQIIKSFDNIEESDFSTNLLIIEPGRIRIRRK